MESSIKAEVVTALNEEDQEKKEEEDLITPLPTSFAALKLKFLKSKSKLNDVDLLPAVSDKLNNLIESINSHPDHFSTSHCSGRIVVYASPNNEPIGSVPAQAIVEDDGDSTCSELEGKGNARSKIQNGKIGGEYLFKTSEIVQVPAEEYAILHLIFGRDTPILNYEDELPLNDADELEESQSPDGLGGIVLFKFESLVLHVTSSSPTASLPFLEAAIATGHANSGLILPNSALASLLHPIPTPSSSELLSAKCRSNLAVRTSSMNLDCPIARKIKVPILPKTHTYSTNGPPPPPPPPPLPSVSTHRRKSHHSHHESSSSALITTTSKSIEYKIGYKLLVPPSYLSFLLRQANLRMEANFKRTLELEKAFEKVLAEGPRGDEWKKRLEEVREERKCKHGIQDLIDIDGHEDVARTVGGVQTWLDGIVSE